MIEPLRRGRTRLYRQTDCARLKLILRGRRLGFSLAEIRDIIAMYAAPPGERGQLEHLIARIGDKRAELELKRRDIRETLRELHAVEVGCRQRLGAMDDTVVVGGSP